MARLSACYILWTGVLCLAAVAPARAQSSPANQAQGTAPAGQGEPLGRLSIEQLSRIEVTSASKHAEPVGETAAAIIVLTQDDLRRAGITTLPDALRLATGVSVGRSNGRTWAISARGFNITSANKLAVFMDGRSIYTPLFSGVFWDVQDYVLQDIDRIEVIRGPAGTLWGANAVNGVVNIITKSAARTSGPMVAIGGGNDLGQLSARYGGALGSRGAYRAYTKYRYRAAQIFDTGDSAHDPLRGGQAGFRADFHPSSRTTITTQGDVYKSLAGLFDSRDIEATGGNVLGRLDHTYSSGAQLQIQAYYDHTWREVPRQFEARRHTGDAELHYRFSVGPRHDVVVGGGYRASHGRAVPSPVLFFEPPARTDRLFSAFIEDGILLAGGVADLTVGSKFEHNTYSGFEYQPTVRGRWTPTLRDTVWGAVSRAVRMPSRFDTDLRLTAGSPAVVLRGDEAFRSETLLAKEIGYRRQIGGTLWLDVAAFHNSYDDLRSLEPTPPSGVPIVLRNELTATTAGVEVTVDYQPVPRWQLHGGYAYLHERFRPTPESLDPTPGMTEHNDPRHQLSFRSFLNLSDSLELDAVLRAVSKLERPEVPAYAELTLHVGWRLPRGLEFRLIGDNLLHGQHPEFGGAMPREEFRRSVFVQTIWRGQ
jgi:iron complex outermembrane receptor protein